MYHYKTEAKSYTVLIYIYCALMHFINTGIEPSGGEKSKDKLMASFQFASAWPQKIEIICNKIATLNKYYGPNFFWDAPKYLSFLESLNQPPEKVRYLEHPNKHFGPSCFDRVLSSDILKWLIIILSKDTRKTKKSKKKKTRNRKNNGNSKKEKCIFFAKKL